MTTSRTSRARRRIAGTRHGTGPLGHAVAGVSNLASGTRPDRGLDSELLGPSMLAVSGLRLRGARLDGRHPDTALVVDYDDLDHDVTGRQTAFPLWQGPGHLDLANQDPDRAAAAVRTRILEQPSP